MRLLKPAITVFFALTFMAAVPAHAQITKPANGSDIDGAAQVTFEALLTGFPNSVNEVRFTITTATGTTTVLCSATPIDLTTDTVASCIEKIGFPWGQGQTYTVTATAFNKSGVAVGNPVTVTFTTHLPVPFHRMYKKVVIDHFYTIKKEEKNNAIQNLGYINPSICCRIFSTDKVPGTVPLYRMFKKGVVNHFYTTSENEKNNAVQNLGYINPHIVGYVYPTNRPGIVPLYRLFHKEKVDHFYTTSKKERDHAVNALGYLYRKVAWYVYPK